MIVRISSSTSAQLPERVKQNLNGLTLQDKRLALDALDIKIIATNDGAEITASVSLEFITTARTSGCLIQIDYDNSTDKEAVSIIPG